MRQGTKAADAIADPHLPSKHGPGAGAPSGRKLKSSHCDLGWGIRLTESMARLALYIKLPSILADPDLFQVKGRFEMDVPCSALKGI